ncbi:MAG: hypothetical protein MRZ79_19590 [Bacteroidia bacterium]|nr:hypothetical protein [Bacteroidia bacterium]
MKRIQLFEFEDFKWFPSWMRSAITNLLVVLHKMMGIPEILGKLLADILKERGLKQIIDLGSGSGGSMPLVMDEIHKIQGMEDVKLVMTDLYPNPEFVRKFNEDSNDLVRYSSTSQDATKLFGTPEGLKTMINSFHHMPPEAAKGILRSAKENRQPILIYEMAENNIPTLIWWLTLPLGLLILMVMVLFMTPFAKHVSFKQVIFTYLIPIIPIFYAWDGQASLPRMYSLDDYDILLEGLEGDDYKWEKGRAKNEKGRATGTFLIGLPQ